MLPRGSFLMSWAFRLKMCQLISLLPLGVCSTRLHPMENGESMNVILQSPFLTPPPPLTKRKNEKATKLACGQSDAYEMGHVDPQRSNRIRNSYAITLGKTDRKPKRKYFEINKFMFETFANQLCQ